MSGLWSLLQPVSPLPPPVARPTHAAPPSDALTLRAVPAAGAAHQAADSYALTDEPSMPGAWQDGPQTATPGALKAPFGRPTHPVGPVSTRASTTSSATSNEADTSASSVVDPRFASWLASLYASKASDAGHAGRNKEALSPEPLTAISAERTEAWRERDEVMVQSAWHLEGVLPRTAKVGLVSSMKAGAMSSGAYSLFLPWIIFTYPLLGLFTPVVLGVVFGLSVGIGALSQEMSRSMAVRRDRKSEMPLYDVNLKQLIALQSELQELRNGRPLVAREARQRRELMAKHAELEALREQRPLNVHEAERLKQLVAAQREFDDILQGRPLDLRETQQLKQLNALRLRYEGGFVNLLRQAVDAVIDGYGVPELHLKSSL